MRKGGGALSSLWVLWLRVCARSSLRPMMGRDVDPKGLHGHLSGPMARLTSPVLLIACASDQAKHLSPEHIQAKIKEETYSSVLAGDAE
jgi:hypothetical protein